MQAPSGVLRPPVISEACESCELRSFCGKARALEFHVLVRQENCPSCRLAVMNAAGSFRYGCLCVVRSCCLLQNVRRGPGNHAIHNT